MNLRDRAFACGVARLRGEPEDHLRELASAEHRATRTLRGAALRRAIEETPPDLRDHFVEELLGIAYPGVPLTVDYVPSHTTEVFHAFDAVGLGPDDTLVDVGSGLGKVVMLASMLTGARARGIELDADLVPIAQSAATALELDRVSFEQADARFASVDDATVLFFYLTFSGAALDRFLGRLRARPTRRLRICGPPLDAPWLRPIAPPCSWLSVYELS